MDVNFKPCKTGMVTVKEKYPCGRGDSKGRNHVYYLCQCDCGKEFIVSGDELSRHPYSCVFGFHYVNVCYTNYRNGGRSKDKPSLPGEELNHQP